jgi:ATP-dependent Lon protease
MLIAKNHLLPRLLRKAGLKKRGQLRLEQAALKKIIEQYAREAGVRRLEKLLGKIVRKVVMKIIKDEMKSVRIRSGDVEDYLGMPVFRKDKHMTGVGIVTGLAWTPMGGATLNVEASKSHGFNREFKLTGQLGDVMRESAEIAYSYIVSNAKHFGAKSEFFERAFIHLHVPAGATRKDGPSAGITMACALLSLAKKRRIRKSIALTGELTLTGYVLPVGGIKEKILAAKRAGIKEVILPEANRGDFGELPATVREGVTEHFVEHYKDVVSLIF